MAEQSDKPAERLIWIDLEMTGLEPEQDVIIEMATIVTDAQLNVLAEGPALVIHQSDEVLDNIELFEVFEPDDGRLNGWSHYELARAIGWAMGGRPRVIGLSPRTMTRAARADRFVRRSRAKLTPDRAAYFNHPDWVVSHGARPPHDLWQPRIETREGLKATARWYREQGWV